MEVRVKEEENHIRTTKATPSPENRIVLRDSEKRTRHSTLDGEALPKKQKQKQKKSVNGNGDSPSIDIPPGFLDPLPAPLEFSGDFMGSPCRNSDSHTGGMDHDMVQSECMQRNATRAQGSSSRRQEEAHAPSRRPANPLGLVDSEHVSRYEQLVRREIIASRYYDTHTLNTLGMLEDIYWLFERVGMKPFIDMKEGTFRSITLEFLSSLNVDVLQGTHCEQGRISFRLLGQPRELTLDEFNAIYNFPRGLGMICRKIPYPTHYNPSHFWTTITNLSKPYKPSNAKATHIKNPCLRYAHKMLASGVFARDESGNVVRSPELYFLYAMFNRLDIDVGSFLACQMHRVATRSEGRIAIGGLITPIAMHFGFDPSANEHDRVQGAERLDLAALEAMKMYRTKGGRPCWIYPNLHSLTLPCPEHTSIRDPNNLGYLPGPEVTQRSPPCLADANGLSHGVSSSSKKPLPPPLPLPLPPPLPSPPPPHSLDFGSLYTTLQSIRTEQAALRQHMDQISIEQIAIRHSVQQMSEVLSQWRRDWHIAQGSSDSPPPPSGHD